MITETYITIWKTTKSEKNGKCYASFSESTQKDGKYTTTYTGTAKITPEQRAVINDNVVVVEGKKPRCFGKAKIAITNIVDKDTGAVSTFHTLLEFTPFKKEEKTIKETETELPFLSKLVR